MKKIPVYLVALTLVTTAHAEPKVDILGVYVGMTKADFIENAKKIGIALCKSTYNPIFKDWEIRNCPNNAVAYRVVFTDNTNLVRKFEYRFITKRTAETIVEDISKQFGVVPYKTNFGFLPSANYHLSNNSDLNFSPAINPGDGTGLATDCVGGGCPDIGTGYSIRISPNEELDKKMIEDDDKMAKDKMDKQNAKIPPVKF